MTKLRKDKAARHQLPTSRQRGDNFIMAIYQLEQDIPEIHDTAFVAESSTVVGKVKMEAHSSVWFNVAIRRDNERSTIGKSRSVH